MLYEKIKRLYERFRLEHYRALFGRIREKAGSLSATEAYTADVIYLLGSPTVSALADTLGVSQPNATYKINSLAAKGYATRTTPDADRRESRVSVGQRFYSYYNTDYPFIERAAGRVAAGHTAAENALFETMLGELADALEQDAAQNRKS